MRKLQHYGIHSSTTYQVFNNYIHTNQELCSMNRGFKEKKISLPSQSSQIQSKPANKIMS